MDIMDFIRKDEKWFCKYCGYEPHRMLTVEELPKDCPACPRPEVVFKSIRKD